MATQRTALSLLHLDSFYSSLVYLFVSTPIGWLVDRLPKSPRLYKATTGAGFFVLFLTFALLGPIGPAALGIPMVDLHVEPVLNKLPFAALAMGLKGLGSALSNNAIYPDLVLGLDEDPLTQATITAWWNAAYAVGWAAGPALGGVLYDALQKQNLCIGPKALPPYCPPAVVLSGGGALEQTLTSSTIDMIPVGGNSTASCSCVWQPQNGFDGFATLTALFSLAFASVLAVAVCANVRNE